MQVLVTVLVTGAFNCAFKTVTAVTTNDRCILNVLCALGADFQLPLGRRLRLLHRRDDDGGNQNSD